MDIRSQIDSQPPLANIQEQATNLLDGIAPIQILHLDLNRSSSLTSSNKTRQVNGKD